MPHVSLIIGSAPDAIRCREFDLSAVSQIVAINNAWRIREDWTHLACAGDFPDEKRTKPGPGQTVVSYQEYVPSNNKFGGVVYAGGTMAFSTAYWALDVLKPDLMAFCGVDMVYKHSPSGSHFYGDGGWDPLRDDVTLRSLEAKANRLMHIAAKRDCLCVNLSNQNESRLTFPRLNADTLVHVDQELIEQGLCAIQQQSNSKAFDAAMMLEADAHCFVESGDYWNYPEQISESDLAKIDALHLDSVQLPVEWNA